MHRLRAAVGRLDGLIARWLARYSVTLLRISLGLAFLGFGVLKFVPGLSPAEDLAQQTVVALTFGLVPESVGLILVAALETVIGLCLLTGRHLRLGLGLLGLAMVGVLSPIVLFPGELFSRPFNAPTLEGQYVLKGVVLLAATLVVAASVLRRRPVADRHGRPPHDHPSTDRRRHWGRTEALTGTGRDPRLAS